jgi:beta-lactamase class A
LESMLSLEDLHHTFTDLGILFPQVVSWNFDNNLKIVDYAAFFRVLFNASYLTKESSQKALELLTHTDFTGGLVAWVSNSDILVAHKFGERGIIGANGIEEKQLHDCWIVYYPDRPYILCVMTRGLDWSKLQQTIADISKMVYEEVASKYR